MKIWRCPHCSAGIRAPGHLRKIDARRYCLPCTDKHGVLVERAVPSRDAERTRAEEQKKAQEAKKRERVAAKRASYAQSERGQLEAFARSAMKLEAFAGAKPAFEIRLARAGKRQDGSAYWRPETSSGHAYGNHRFVITAGSDPADARATILHEIAHCAAGYDGGPHGDKWRGVFAASVDELTGETPSGKTHRDLHAQAIECVKRWMTP